MIPRKLPRIDICYAPAGSSYFDSVCFVSSTEGFLRILVCRGTFTTVDAQISSQQLSWRCNLRWVPIVLLTESQSPRQRESLADRIASRNLRSRSLPGSGRSNSAVPVPAMFGGVDRGLRDRDRVPSRWSSGKDPLASSASPDCSFAGKESKEDREMSHEGWLAKRSSGKISGRLGP